jgi:ankyrin repeat protein
MDFVEAALSDLKRAESILARHPEVANASPYAALVLGNSTPEIEVRAQGGPRNWTPLLYVCFSRFADASSTRSAHLVETAKTLLKRGSDPNAFYIDDRYPDSPLSCLYAAPGLHNNPSLALALLEAGANPNDGESLYHSTEHPDLQCMRLLLSNGASPKGSNALKHMLDREDPEGLKLLLDAGADPNAGNAKNETALHWAVWRGRSKAARPSTPRELTPGPPTRSPC